MCLNTAKLLFKCFRFRLLFKLPVLLVMVMFHRLSYSIGSSLSYYLPYENDIDINRLVFTVKIKYGEHVTNQRIFVNIGYNY